MKKFTSYLFAVAALATAFTFQSCTKSSDDTTVTPAVSLDKPTSAVGADSISVSSGTSFTITAKAHAPAGFTSVAVTLNGTALTNTGTAPGASDTTFTFSVADTIIGNGVTNTYTLTATDKNNKVSSKTFTVKTLATNVFSLNGPYNVLGNDTVLYSTASESAVKLSNATASPAVQSTIDLVYFHTRTSNIAIVTAPSDPSDTANYPSATTGFKAWTNKNVTILSAAGNTFDYANATSATIKATLGTAAGTRVDGANLGANMVVVFKTSTGKYGAFKVITDPGNATGNIKIDIKHVK